MLKVHNFNELTNQYYMVRNNLVKDQDLLDKLQQGYPQAYQQLFDTYYNILHSYLVKHSHDSNLSDDLIQNVMIRIWEKRKSLHINTSLKSYLFRACHNEFLMHIRKQKKQVDLLDRLKWEVLSQNYTEEKEDQNEVNWQKIEHAIDQLPDRCKEVFKLSRLEQKKHKEIASILGISTKTIENQITKAVKFIKSNVSSFFIW